MTKPAVIYARVSSKEQEREGFSIPAQLKLLRDYATRNDLSIAKEFVDIETAKTSGRLNFDQMVQFFTKNRRCRIVLVEKTDRLYRNFRDAVTLEDLDLEIHLVKEGQVISKDAKSQAKLIHGMQLVLARNYIENLREEVKKGMREKAEQGIYPGRAPLGYRNNRADRTIEVHPESAALVHRIFELYASGRYSLSQLKKAVQTENGKHISRAYLHAILTNPFYVGSFLWGGNLYRGTHPSFIEVDLYECVQAVLRGHNKPKYRKQEFAFRGLLHCAQDHCAITAERKKQKYVYYRCTGYRGKCTTPRFTEPEIAEKLGGILKGIQIPDHVLTGLQKSLARDQEQAQAVITAQRNALQPRLTAVRRRIDQAYQDKLDGKIPEEFWKRKMAEWTREERSIQDALARLDQPANDRLLTAQRTLELANKAYSLYLTRNPQEQAQLLRMVLLNCAIDGASVQPTYRKPFDLIFERAKSQEWSGREDLNLRPPGPELGGTEPILLLLNHLSGASTVSFVLKRASLGVM
jgi:site-specific DNA recombinase